MYAYCLNNPVTYYDPTGNSAKAGLLFLTVVTVVAVATVVVGLNDTVIHSSKEMDVCTDGKFCNETLNGAQYPYGDEDHWGATATLNGICADCVNYMVVPKDYPNANALMGCVGVIINNQTGEYVYAVVCEKGPAENGGSYGACAWDEVSIRAAWLLNGHSPGASIGNNRQEGSYTFIIFANSKQEWNISSALQDEIDAVGRNYWPLV